MAKLDLPEQPELATKVVESHTRLEERALEMGKIGKWFGNATEKPGNIAGFSIVASVVCLMVVFMAGYVWPNANNTGGGQLLICHRYT